jgi:hypothetical protein
VFLKLPVGSWAKKRLTVIEHETRHQSTERAGTHGKGLGGERSQAHERRAGSFVRLLHSREVSSSSQPTTARAFLHLLLLRSVAVVDRSCIGCSCCCCCEWWTSLVAFLVSFQLSFAFIFGL